MRFREKSKSSKNVENTALYLSWIDTRDKEVAA